MIGSRWEDPRFARGAILALVLVCMALVVHEIFGENGYLALRKRRQELTSLEQHIQQLQQENQKLEKQIQALKTDPKAIEKLAREQMHLARPGEMIYTLPEKKEPSAANDAQAAQNKQ